MQQAHKDHETILRVEDLHKHYGGVHALRGLSFRVPRGSFYGLFGRNGAGKTTSFDVITGLAGRDRGIVELFGEQVGLEPSVAVKQRLAYVGGHICLYGWMTLQEHLDFVAGFYPTWDPQRCEELKDLFSLPMTQVVSTLSPGQHIQFQLLMALPRRPELLIMDEPGNLDPVVRLRLMATMTDILHSDQATILMASHLLDELEGVCDHMCIIDHGTALVAGRVEDLVAHVRQVRLYGITDPLPAMLEDFWYERVAEDEVRVLMPDFSEAAAGQLARDLGAKGHDIEQVGLQDLFIALTADRD